MSKIWKSCDFECVQDRYQCCVIFAFFLSCVLGVFNSPVATPAHGLLPESSITIYIGERQLALYICATTTVPLHQVVNSASFLWTLSVATVHIFAFHVWPFAFMLQVTWIKQYCSYKAFSWLLRSRFTRPHPSESELHYAIKYFLKRNSYRN